MARKTTNYICSECGYKSATQYGKCPSCKSFETMIEEISETPSTANRITSKNTNANKLKEIIASNTSNLLKTDIEEFDRVVGGGLVADSVNVISAPPGTGKSTLLLSVAQALANKGHIVLYIAGEESESQIKLRAERILSNISENIYIKSETNLETILSTIDNIAPEFLIIDSIQMLFSDECEGTLGGEKQMIHCTSAILNKAKNSSRSMCVFFVGQVTKEDELRGSREFEHMVDAVFTLSIGDDSGILRMFKSTKNRFGDTSEVGLFEMKEEGLKELTNPNKYFITERTTPVSGSVITAIKEGSRTIAIEINALAESNNFTYPSRISQGISKDFLQILLAVMENKLSSNTKKKDIYVQTSNGIRVKDTYIGLGVIAAIDSAVNKIPIASDIAFIGEVSLTGEIKKVPNIDRIISDFERMGFKEIVIPANNATKKHSKIKVTEIHNIKDIQKIIKP